MATVLRQTDFNWRGFDLHWGRRRMPVRWLVADETWPHLYRIRYPDGWTSEPANLTWAKDAAYGHARYLLTQETPDSGPYSLEDPVLGIRLAEVA